MLAGGIAGLIVTRHPAGGVAGGILGALARGKIDDFLRALGRKVLRNPDEGVKGARRQGDLIVDGIKTEVKTLDPGATSATIRNTVNNSLRRGGQAREIIIDARGSSPGLRRKEGLPESWDCRQRREGSTGSRCSAMTSSSAVGRRRETGRVERDQRLR